jgi:hypothetical protein
MIDQFNISWEAKRATYLPMQVAAFLTDKRSSLLTKSIKYNINIDDIGPKDT